VAAALNERERDPLAVWPSPRATTILAVVLLLGSLLLTVSALLHPLLPLTASGDLAMIESTPYWRAIHIALLYGTGMIMVGIWARWCSAERGERPGLAISFFLLGVGHALNGVNIAYMTGAGTLFARLAAGGADVAGVYQATHLFAVACGRLGGFLVSAAAGLIALTTGSRQDEPRWLISVATVACIAGLLGNIFATPGNPLMLTGIGIMALWQIVTAGRILRAQR